MNETQGTIVTRMAPSPTGPFHVGGVRTLLFNYFYARQQGGKFVLRSEDTDHERSKPEFEAGILEALEWLGLRHDEFYRQSENLERHQEALRQLIDSGAAYEAEESQSGEGKVIRFKNPNKTIVINDGILGEVTFDTTDLEDFVIARNFNSPLYHLAVVIDDSDEGVTHVIRAQEHLANTPRQMLLIGALGLRQPAYAHVPFILGPDGKKKLSKRDGDVAILDYRDKGYLPEAMINFLSFIGFNPGGEREVYALPELIEVFDLAKVQKGPAGFNVNKLRWLNKEHLQQVPDEDFLARIQPFVGKWSQEDWTPLLPILRERLMVYGDLLADVEAGEYDWMFEAPAYSEPEKIIWKKGTREEAVTHLGKVHELLAAAEVDWSDAEALKAVVWPYAEEVGRGDVLWPTRFALSGREKSPDPFSLLSLVGKDEALARLEKAIQALS